MTTSIENLKVLLKDPEKTSNVLDLIQKEIKEMSIAVYDRVFKDFAGKEFNSYKAKCNERYKLTDIAEKEIAIKGFEIRNKYFNTL